MKDELLLTEIRQTIRKNRGNDVDSASTAKELLAKLKDLGYEQVWIKCPECGGNGFLADGNEGITINRAYCPTCNGIGKITKYVKWDREKVAETLGSYAFKKSWYSLSKLQQEASLGYADQLKEILTGGE